VQLGVGSGALLGMAAVAMSDMRGGNPLGELGVKAAWGECLYLQCFCQAACVVSASMPLCSHLCTARLYLFALTNLLDCACGTAAAFPPLQTSVQH
jgi:hypothetical protein